MQEKKSTFTSLPVVFATSDTSTRDYAVRKKLHVEIKFILPYAPYNFKKAFQKI